MKILFIAPLPLPINGQSIAAKLLLDNLIEIADIDLVDTSKSSHKDGLTSFKRIIEVISFFKKIIKYRESADLIYLHISESLFGNIKDLVIYFLCRKKIDKFYIHLHGGSFGVHILEKYFILKIINVYYLKKIKAVIVLGDSHVNIFSKYIDISKIHVIPNFFLPEFLISDELFSLKFNSKSKLKFLYLSNMIHKKGYLRLLDAFLMLDNNIKEQVQIDFAGRFNTETEELFFREKIRNYNNLNYLGVVSGRSKQQILVNSHVFVLPTSYYEGQPISILEAYSSGCAVITSKMGGIPDIFKEEINGFALFNNSKEEISVLIEHCVNNFEEIKVKALNNLLISRVQYNSDLHIKRLLNLIINKI